MISSRDSRLRLTAAMLSPSTLGAAVLIMLALLAALLAGVVASWANPILTALLAALLVGPMLMARPVAMLWLILSLGLLLSGVLPIWASGAEARVVWGISGLSFLLMMLAFFRVATGQSGRQSPLFIKLSLWFMAFAVFNAAIQADTLYQGLSGFKRYFQAYGVMLAIAWLAVGEQTIRRLRVFFVLVALAQLPWAVYERLILVPIREGFRYAYPGLVPVDVVAGTFGAQMYAGGANAEMATFLIIVLAFLLARWREGVLRGGRLLWLLPPILAPLFLGETKVVVLLLPLMFIVLYRTQLLRRPLLVLGALTMAVVLTVGVTLAYLSITGRTLDDQIADTLSYNVQHVGYGNYKLNKTTTLMFWAERQGLNDPVGFVFGHGLGAAHEPTGGEIARRYPMYGVGLTALSTLLWEQGVFGTLLFVGALVAAWFNAGRLRRRAADASMRADTDAIQASIALFLFYLIYRTTQIDLLTFQLVVASVLGYLAWLWRTARTEPRADRL